MRKCSGKHLLTGFAAMAVGWLTADTALASLAVGGTLRLGDQGAYRIDYVVGDGDQLPGLDAPLDGVDYLQLNSAGDISANFYAGEQSGVLLAPYGEQASPYMVSGQPAPGAEGLLLDLIVTSGITDNGDIMAYWLLSPDPDASTNAGFGEVIYFGAGATPNILVHSGSPAPGGIGRVFEHFNPINPAAHRNGGVALYAYASGGPPGYWWYEPGVGGRESIQVGEELAPGETVNDPLYAKFDANGRAAFVAELNFDSSSFGLWTEGPMGGFLPIAQIGDPVPGAADGVRFVYPRLGFLPSNSGEVFFPALVGGPGIDSSNDEGIWVRRAHGLVEPLFLEGQDVPSESDSVFSAVGITSLSQNGTALGGARIQSKSDGSLSSILWSLSPEGEFSTLTESGDPAPGVSDLAEFLGFSGQAYINDAGEVAFIATLTDGREGLWVIDALGEMHMIVREGDNLELPSGDTRTIAGFSLQSEINESLNSSQFTETGRLPIFVRFTDRSDAIYLLSLNQVPEPSAVVSCLVLLVSSLLRRSPANRVISPAC